MGVPKRRVSHARQGERRSHLAIDLPHPRSLDMKTHEQFGEYTRRIYKLLGME